MDPIEKRELKRKAWMRLAAQRRRAGVLRGSVVVVSVICFVVFWGVVFAQMASGNDPVLSGKEPAASTQVAASTQREIETTDPRELEPDHATDSKSREREAEAEITVEPGIEVEAEIEELEAEPEFEEAEVEPLVTSQS